MFANLLIILASSLVVIAVGNSDVALLVLKEARRINPQVPINPD